MDNTININTSTIQKTIQSINLKTNYTVNIKRKANNLQQDNEMKLNLHGRHNGKHIRSSTPIPQ